MKSELFNSEAVPSAVSSAWLKLLHTYVEALKASPSYEGDSWYFAYYYSGNCGNGQEGEVSMTFAPASLAEIPELFDGLASIWPCWDGKSKVHFVIQHASLGQPEQLESPWEEKRASL